MDKLIYLVPVMGIIGFLYTFVKFNGLPNRMPVLTA